MFPLSRAASKGVAEKGDYKVRELFQGLGKDMEKEEQALLAEFKFLRDPSYRKSRVIHSRRGQGREESERSRKPRRGGQDLR